MKGSRRIIARVIACVLLLSMFTSNLVYAGMQAGSNETGGGGYINPSGSIAMRGNGVIFGLQVTENKSLTESDKEAIRTQQEAYEANSDGKVYFDQIGATIVDSYLYHYPDFLCNTSITGNYGLIIRDKVEPVIDTSKQFLIGSNGQRSGKPFKKVYRCASKGTASDLSLKDLVSKAIKGDSVKLKSFTEGKLTFEEVKSIMSSLDSYYKNASASFVSQFVNMGTVATNLNKILKYDKAEDNLLVYLDFITLIYYMVGQDAQTEYAIKTFLKNLNADDSDAFVTLFMASVVCIGPETYDWNWFTLPNFYSYISGASVDRYQNIVSSYVTQRKAITQKTRSGNKFTSDQAKWIADYYAQYNAVKKFRTDAPYNKFTNMNKELMWWSENQFKSNSFSNMKSATMLMPTDMWGDQTGSLGFTYFNTSRVVQTIDPDPDGDIKLYIDEGKKNNTVEKPGTKTSATVVIDLTTEDVQKKKETRKTFDYAKTNNKPVRVTVELSAKTVEGSPINTSNFDSLLMPSSLSIDSSKKIVWNDVTWDAFKPYMTGEKVMKFNDADITINETTKIEYYAKLHLEVVGVAEPIECWFKGNGEESNSDEYTAQTSWICTTGETPPDPTEPEPPKTGSFHSTMEQPYVEIKEGTPGNETFEAMAGVPTNRNLYVSFGASEFMLNLEVEMKTGDESQRTYKLTFTAKHCYDTDALCDYTCPGEHQDTTYINGCNALVCKSLDPTHKHTDACYCKSGTAPKVSCSSGPVTAYSECSCGRERHETPFIPKYGDGCANSCTADGTKCYTGMGCEHTCHETKGDANKAHAYEKTFTVTINQKIAEHPYLAITGLDLWQVTKLALKGNPLLLTNPDVSVDPNTGYYAFYGEEGYSDKNGRLSFSQWLTSTEKLGNTETSKTTTEYLKPEDAAKKATEWVDNLVRGKKVKADVISDYLVLATTMGYQVPLLSTYSSDEVEIISDSVAFTADETSKVLDGSELTFSTPDTFDKMWTNNTNSAANWSPDAIVRSGYNGLYSRPTDKFTNILKSFTTVNPLSGKEYLVTDKDEIYGAFLGNGLSNLRMSINGLGIQPTAENKEWYTGYAELTAKKVISFGKTSGINYANSGDDYVCEVGYTNGKPHINNIIIHNPVSTQYATVMCNDSKYDMRSAASLLDGVSLGSVHMGCPLDGSCEFCVLKGTCTPSNHTDDCWKNVQSGMTHAGGMNAHVCDSGCTGGYTTHVHTEDCKTTTEPVVHHHTGSPSSGGGCYKPYYSSRTCGGHISCTSDNDGYNCYYCGASGTTVYRNIKCDTCGATYANCVYCTSCNTGSTPPSTCTNSFNVQDGYVLGCGYKEGQVIQEGGTVWTCGFAYNQTVGEDSGLVDSITLPYTFTIDGVKHRVSGSGKVPVKPDWWFKVVEHTGGTGKCLYRSDIKFCLSCNKSVEPSAITKNYGTVAGIDFPKGGGCTGELNTHVCSSACTPTYSKVIVCDNPHHVGVGEPWDPNDIKNHYSKGDSRCWKPCGDDNKHKEASKVVINGTEVSLNDVFINLDKSFTVYFPDIGDFADMPNLHGILDCTSIRGMGYTDKMSTAPYTKGKFVTLPVK